MHLFFSGYKIGINVMKKICFLTIIAVATSVTGCSIVSKHFIAQPPNVMKMSSSKYQVDFVVEEGSNGEAVFERLAKEKCPSGLYELDSHSREDVPGFYSIIKATMVCK